MLLMLLTSNEPRIFICGIATAYDTTRIENKRYSKGHSSRVVSVYSEFIIYREVYRRDDRR